MSKLRNPELCAISKIYTFSTLNQWLPGNLRATDVDAAVERNGNFLFFEFKGHEVYALKRGQRLFWENLLRELDGHGILVLVEHPPLDTSTKLGDPFADAEAVRISWWDKDDNRVWRTVRIRAAPDTMKWILVAWEQMTTGNGVPLHNFLVSHATER